MQRQPGHVGPSVLVVEDDEASGEGYAQLLGGEGYVVHWARNGYEALAEVSRQSPSLIMLDLKVPKIDGWELLERLTSDGASAPGIPIIVVTGDALSTHHDMARSRGASVVLTKPIDPSELLAAVRRALER